MKSFFKKFISTQEEEQDQTKKNLRVHARYSVGGISDYLSIISPSGDIVPALDLSYGGFSVVQKFSGHLRNLETAKIRIFDKETTAHFYHIYDSPTSSGFAFRHETPDLLLFLRNFIEYIRMGHSCKELSKSILKEPYNGEAWTCYRGDGPSDIYFCGDSGVEEFLLLFAANGQYSQIRFVNGTLHCGQSENKKSGNAGAIVKEEAGIDRTTVERALLLLLGLDSSAGNKRQTQEALSLLLDSINSEKISA